MGVKPCMPHANDHYKAIQEGILRAKLIRKDLSQTPTEYYPEKVRGLTLAYIQTIKEIIKQGEFFLDKGGEFELGLKVTQIIENYRAFLSTLNEKEQYHIYWFNFTCRIHPIDSSSLEFYPLTCRLYF